MGVLKTATGREPKKAGLFLALAFLGFLLWSGPALSVETVQLNEGKIKAGLLYNFLKHTQWAESEFSSPDEALRICLLGGDAFEGALYPLAGRTAQQRVIDIQALDRFEDNCNVLFFHQMEKQSVEKVLQKLHGQPILTVGDIDGFAAAGGMIEFTKGRDRRIHLRVNRQALQESGLSIQERLLNLAELVQ